MVSEQINTTNKYKAFTLVELLFVMTIIGILAAIILVNLDAGRRRSIMSKNVSQLDQIAKALEAYKTQTGSYPPTPLNNWQGFCSAYGSSLGADWIPQLRSSGLVTTFLPVDTRQEGNASCVDNTKQYIYVSNGTDYKLISVNLTDLTGAPSGVIDPVRPTTAIGHWSTGAASW